MSFVALVRWVAKVCGKAEGGECSRDETGRVGISGCKGRQGSRGGMVTELL